MMDAPERMTREDGLPESKQYRDTGCSLAPSCLKCPFEACRYEHPGGNIRKERTAQRVVKINSLLARGWNNKAVAKHLGISTRQVFRLRRTT